MIAIATAASAAAMVIIKMTKKIPSSLSGYKYLLNTTKLMFTLFKISSIAISMVIILRRVNNPYIPMKNKAVLTNKICDRGTSLMFLKFHLLLFLFSTPSVFPFLLLLFFHWWVQAFLWRSQYTRS